MKLIGSLTSPYVRKVRIVMAEKKLDYQLVLEDVWSADTQMARYNPLGKVPCLLMDGGEALHDSRVIVEYLDTLSPVGKLLPPSGRERAEVKTWEALADGLLDAAILARLEATWPGRTAGQRSQAWIDRQVDKITHAAGHEPGPGRQATLQWHLPQPVGLGGGLCAGLPGLPFSTDRLAQRPPQPGPPGRQAEPAHQLHRDTAALRLSQRISAPTTGSFSYSSSAASQ